MGMLYFQSNEVWTKQLGVKTEEGVKTVDGVRSEMKAPVGSAPSFPSSGPSAPKSGISAAEERMRKEGSTMAAGKGIDGCVDGGLSDSTRRNIRSTADQDTYRDVSGALSGDDGIVDFRINGDDEDTIGMSGTTSTKSKTTMDLNDAIVPDYHPQQYGGASKVASVESTPTTNAASDASPYTHVDPGKSANLSIYLFYSSLSLHSPSLHSLHHYIHH